MCAQKIAIITGGGSGIGLAIAEKFVAEGIYTIVIGRDKKKLNSVQDNVLKEQGETIAFDLNNTTAVPQLISDIISQHATIDILVNNAGINMKKELTEVSDEDFQQIMHTNVNALFSISREVIKYMLPAEKGAIVNITSMAALYGLPKVIAYTASKAALEGMTKAMATELSPKGIRVNAVAPGFIRTAMSSKALDSDPERKERVFKRTPMGYLGETADIAAAVYYLVSDEAKYITGTSLRVDGGNASSF